MAVCAALLVAAGCGKKKGTEPPPPPPPAPTPSSPAALLDLIEYCWNYRDSLHYAEVFTDDFQFVFAADDSAGSPYRNNPWTRANELAMAGALFHTGLPGHPRAQTIDLQFTNNPVVMPDPRLGRDPPWHKNIRTTVVLSVTTVDGNRTNITGFANFFMTRGDSAAIPPDLIARGFLPDSTRWYLDRWEDETTHSSLASRAQPTRQVTWGYLKVQYVEEPPALASDALQRRH
jgi:hypothetical protein